MLATQQIASALRNHPARVTVIVPQHAMSGGTLVALAAGEILMDENAVLGPVDAQVGEYPAVSLLRVIGEKDKNELDDETLILADVARRALAQIQQGIADLVRDRIPPEQAQELIVALTEGRWTHDYPITVTQARALGLAVSTDMPPDVYALMDRYPQPRQTRPSVQFVPVPYRREPEPARRTRSTP